MSNTNTGGPAFPAPITKPLENYYPGISVREYFAAKAMQVIYSANCEWEPTGTPADEETLKLFDEVATDAYAMADAMLKAREA
jgi:hypothetical protein